MCPVAAYSTVSVAAAPPVPENTGGGGFYATTYPHIRTEDELRPDERGRVEIIDYSTWSMEDILSLLAEMRPKEADLESFKRRIRPLLPNIEREIVADPITNLSILLRNVPRKKHWLVEQELRNILAPLVKHQNEALKLDGFRDLADDLNLLKERRMALKRENERRIRENIRGMVA
jgi:hypothetical protein